MSQTSETMPPSDRPDRRPDLPDLLAKSPTAAQPAGESLTSHSAATLRALGEVERRLGRLLPPDRRIEAARFWRIAAWAALTHDAGKVADGFQRMLRDNAGWGHRHEVLSLGFLPHLIDIDGPPRSADDRAWVAVGVATHHRALASTADGGAPALASLYGEVSPDGLRAALGSVDTGAAADLLAWFRNQARAAGLVDQPDQPENAGHPGHPDHPDHPEYPGQPDRVDRVGMSAAGELDSLAFDAHRVLHELFETWVDEPVRSDHGLTGVLLQGAVTMADHLSSAHGRLHSRQPFDAGYAGRLASRLAARGRVLHPHQKAAADVDGHLVLRAWTGSGKTEAGLLWASRQVEAIVAGRGGVPRVFYTLPYLASINAMTMRLAERDVGDKSLIGVSHSRAASYYLSRSLCGDDDGPGAAAAAKALARANATRLFQETVRVGTPYQQLRGALAGAVHSSVLLDSANSVVLLDELHAYDPQRLGYLLAMLGLWARLGTRIGVLSATLPARLVNLVRDSLEPADQVHSTPAVVADPAGAADSPSVTVVEADTADAPTRHRIRTIDAHLTGPAVHAAIARRLAAGESVLVVANNIKDAQDLFGALAPLAPPRLDVDGDADSHDDNSDADGDDHVDAEEWDELEAGAEDALTGVTEAVLLHSRFRRGDRSRIERRINDRYRSDQSPDERRPGLVVGTQAVEVSLDVDFDVLFTSCAPLDALAQRFGRVNRSGARPPADVVVCHAEMRARRNGRAADLFADGVYPQEPTDAAWRVLTTQDGCEVGEADLVRWLDDVYDSAWGDTWSEDVARYRDEFRGTFLAFAYPFADRSALADSFDEMFDGAEGVLRQDRDRYQAALDGAGTRGQGRLLAADLLIPLPDFGKKIAEWDRRLEVYVIDGDYDPGRGLTAIRGKPAVRYQPGELI